MISVPEIGGEGGDVEGRTVGKRRCEGVGLVRVFGLGDLVY